MYLQKEFSRHNESLYHHHHHHDILQKVERELRVGGLPPSTTVVSIMNSFLFMCVKGWMLSCPRSSIMPWYQVMLLNWAAWWCPLVDEKLLLRTLILCIPKGPCTSPGIRRWNVIRVSVSTDRFACFCWCRVRFTWNLFSEWILE